MRGRAGRRVSIPSNTRWKSRAASSLIFRPMRLRSTLVGQSQGAAGALQGIQSTNQLLALQSRQLGSTQALLSANARAQATEAMRRAEVEEAARADRHRFRATAVSYTLAP